MLVHQRVAPNIFLRPVSSQVKSAAETSMAEGWDRNKKVENANQKPAEKTLCKLGILGFGWSNS